MKELSLFFVYISLFNLVNAQNNSSLTSKTALYSLDKVITNPTKDIELAFSPDNFTGKYSQGIAYNPTYQYYYAFRNIGSKNNLEVFDINGKRIQSTIFSQEVKNIWYNSTLNKIEAYYKNDNEDINIISYKTDNNGMIINEQPKIELSNIPIADVYARLNYNAYDNLYFYFNSDKDKVEELSAFDATDFGSAVLQLPVSKSNINKPMLLYTNIENAEYALYDYKSYKLYLFNYKGELQKTITLPNSIPSTAEYINICIANKHFFAFDGYKYKWLGYKIVN